MQPISSLFQNGYLTLAATLAAIVALLLNAKKIRGVYLDVLEYFRKRSDPPPKKEWPQELSARFASSRGSMTDVLDLRQRVFTDVLKKQVISSDESYWSAFERNRYSFSLVTEAGIPIGYWGIFPVSKANYETFVSGGLTHEQMLSEACLAWEDADPENLYLYYVGAVSLNRTCLAEDQPKVRYMEFKTLLDSIVVGYGLSKKAKIKGIAVYASTGYGWKLCEKKLLRNGFVETGVFAGDDKITEILTLGEDHVEGFFDAMRTKHIDPHLNEPKTKQWISLNRWLKNAFYLPEQAKAQPQRDLRETGIVSKMVRKPPASPDASDET